MPVTDADLAIVTQQLGRPSRGVAGIAWRCPFGFPGVVKTAPRLPPDEPFPTTYYLTCPAAVVACSRLEAASVMAEMTARLQDDPDLQDRYRAAHQAYLGARAELAKQLGISDVPRPTVSAGGMPDRVKCLHALVAQSLATGAGVNPFGDESLAMMGDFWNDQCGPTGGCPE